MCFELDERVRLAFLDIDLISRYQKLSDRFQPGWFKQLLGKQLFDDLLEYIDRDTVCDIFDRLGWGKVKYFKSETCFRSKTVEIGDFSFYCNVAPKGGIVELIWVVLEGEKCLFGRNIGGVPVYMYDECETGIRTPQARSYADLEEILRVNFELFGDFIDAFIKRAHAAGEV